MIPTEILEFELSIQHSPSIWKQVDFAVRMSELAFGRWGQVSCTDKGDNQLLTLHIVPQLYL